MAAQGDVEYASNVAPDLSVVIPVYNEEENLEQLHREFSEVLKAVGRPYELILVDDGSTDRSFEVLTAIHARDPHVRVIQFRRNFGQTAGFAAGFAAARGALIITADADLQNDPRDIPNLLAEIDKGADIACGWRKDRKDKFLTRRVPSTVANKLISSITGVKLNDYGCSLKAFRAEVIKPVRLSGEMHRFLPALASEVGVRVVEIPVSHRARVHGKSKYGLGRTIRVTLDLITVKFLLSYSRRPLQIFGLIGGVMGLAGAVIVGYLGIQRLLGNLEITNHLPLTLFGMLLIFTGIQLVTVGLLAEMQARALQEAQARPIYVVRRTLEH